MVPLNYIMPLFWILFQIKGYKGESLMINKPPRDPGSSMRYCMKCQMNYDNKEICIECLAGYNLSNGSCFPIEDNNCLLYDINNEICIKCDYDYLLLLNGCRKKYSNSHPNEIKTDMSCLLFMDEMMFKYSKCLEIEQQPYNSSSKITNELQIISGFIVDDCKDIDDNCLECSDWGYCVKCDHRNNYYSFFGKCVKFSPANELRLLSCNQNCQTCVANICTQCDPGYEFDLVNNNLCVLKCTIPNCLKCSPANYCQDCSEGYFNNNGDCIQCHDVGCAECIGTNIKQCSQCRLGFTIYEGQCGYICQSISNCILCSSESNSCLKCNETKGYKLLDNGICKKKNQQIITLSISLAVVSVVAVLGIIFVIYIVRKISLLKELQNRGTANTDQNANNENNIINLYTRAISHVPSPNIQNVPRNSRENSVRENKIMFDPIQSKDCLCFMCKKQIGNFKLSCGCLLCKKDNEELTLTLTLSQNRSCPCCGNEYDDIHTHNFLCEICYEGVDTLYKLPCECALNMCLPCFNEIAATNKCPNCRGTLTKDYY